MRDDDLTPLEAAYYRDCADDNKPRRFLNWKLANTLLVIAFVIFFAVQIVANVVGG